jgi:hypothetical protein
MFGPKKIVVVKREEWDKWDEWDEWEVWHG